MLPSFLLVAGLLQAGTFTPFVAGPQDSGVDALALDAAGDTLLIYHRFSRSLTRYDVATQAVEARVELGPAAVDWPLRPFIEWIPGSRDALVLDTSRQLLIRIDTQSMTVLGEAQVSVEFARDVALTSDGTRCVLIGSSSSSPTVSVVNTTTMTEERVIVIGPTSAAFDVPDPSIWITSDDRRIVVLGPDPAGGSYVTLLGFSLSTGLLEASAALPFTTSLQTRAEQSGDRSTWVVTRGTNVDPLQELYRVTGADLQGGNALAFPGFRRGPFGLRLDSTGTRAWGIFSGTLFGFPVDRPLVTPGSTDVHRFPGPVVGAFAVSGDDRRVLVGDRRNNASIHDGAGLLLASDVASIHQTAQFRGMHQAEEPVFAVVRSGLYDQVMVLDARGPLPGIEEHVFNSSPLESFDGPYGITELPGTGEVAVRALSSSKLGVFNGVTGVSRGTVDLLPGSTDLDVRSDGIVLAGHRGGELLAIDPETITEVGRVILDGAIEQVNAEPSGTRAWVRIGGTIRQPGGAALVLVETQGPLAGELGRVDLAGSCRPLIPYVHPRGGIYYGFDGGYGFVEEGFDAATASMVFDHARGLAYGISPVNAVLEVIDLASFSVVDAFSFASLVPYGDSRSTVTLAPGGEHLILSLVDGTFLFRATPTGLAQVASLDCGFGGQGFFTTQGFSRDGQVAFMLYSASALTGCQALEAVDVSNGQTLDALSAEQYFGVYGREDELALVSSDGVEVVHFDGANFSAPERVLGGAGRIAFDPTSGVLAAAGYEAGPWGTGLWTADLFQGRLQTACDAGAPNATGVQATLTASGSPFAGESLVLTSSGLMPFGMPGVLGVSDALAPPMPAASGLGEFCLGGTFRRFAAPIEVANASGQREHVIATDSFATSTGPVSVAPGSTWVFQEWHRDVAPSGAATSNASTAVAITFR